MDMICRSMSISASTELTEFFVYFVSQNTALPFGNPLCWRPRHMPPYPPLLDGRKSSYEIKSVYEYYNSRTDDELYHHSPVTVAMLL